jgi:uncharacterized membrane protein YidH (DUF202 family)
MAVLFAVGFCGFAHFLPPTSPQQSALSLSRFIAANRTSLRIGLVLTAIGAAFLGPFIAVITVQMKRIEGRHTPLAYTQLAMGAIFVFEFIVPILVMQTLIYRPRSLGDTQLFSDMFWLMFVGVVSTGAIEWVAIGIAILRDRREQPIYPRWVGYVNLWMAACFCPGNLVFFFKGGPFAWNGLLSWYVTVIGFFIWLVVMVISTLAAIRRQDADEGTGAATVVDDSDGAIGLRLARIDGDIAALRDELTDRVARKV